MDSKEFDKKKEFIDKLREDYKYGINKFDTQALYLSGGALALGLTLAKDIVPLKDAICIYIYYLSLILFALTIVIGFYGHYKSSQLILDYIKKIENDDFSRVNHNIILVINKFVIILLILGILSLISYTIINIENITK